jgi:hypothetical protein
MASRADTLKISQADLSMIRENLFEAGRRLEGRSPYAFNPGPPVFQAILTLEKTVKRLRRSFNLGQDHT